MDCRYMEVYFEPKIQPVGPDDDPYGDITLCQQQGGQQIHIRPTFELKDTNGNGYRARLSLQDIGIRNTIRRFVEVVMDGDAHRGLRYYELVRTAILCFPEGRDERAPLEWKRCLLAAKYLVKYCALASDHTEIAKRQWTCHKCKEHVDSQMIKSMVAWICNTCLEKPNLPTLVALYCYNKPAISRLYMYLYNTGILN